ncbi:hypothetical protein HBI25_223640 [Parastagonospora nodorum]|nr:hypothetical protein HBH49_140670 [Parastagonospora nodorum]KAH4098370.1 hypothetical protein HBH48_032700 [Parastagonospora nodorum]KAH4357236.1 hypothetical protein HBH94_222260 [Parastagonospora nodorum]KAH4419342.1 hypothetical protein HBH92_044870 [Parastagonospora nodorum]KAH4448327.1 hypothetical protein HBH90_204950 [Parastagonospora nodorum]
MDNVTTLLEKISIDSDIETEYKVAFESILRFVKEYRTSTITEHELEVTEALAGPFTQGGMLIVLLEPRRWHPWTQGIHYVIQNCKSLRVMDDGLKFVSEEVLSLTNGVSLLDLRPLLVKGDYPHLESKVWERLYDLVYEAIKAKKPDVLLCMGNEAKAAFDSRNFPLMAYSLRENQIIRAHHPGHFFDQQSIRRIAKKAFWDPTED